MTDRDYELIEFLNKFKVADTTIIKQFFFPSISTARRRLKILINKKKIKRLRNNINKDYTYFTKEPKQLKHSLEVINFYSKMSKKYNITNFKTEPNLGSIQPDAIFTFIDNEKTHLACLEVELSNKGADIKKYEKFYNSNEYKNYFPIFPKLFIVSKQQIAHSKLDIVVVPQINYNI